MPLTQSRRPLTLALALSAALLPNPAAAIADDRSRASAAPPAYGLADDLVRIDRATLRPLPGRSAPVSGDSWAWSFDARRRRIALVSDSPGPELRFVDLRTMRVTGDAKLARRGSAWATAWVAPRRVLGVVVTTADDTVVAAVDPATRRVAWRRRLGGSMRVGKPYGRGLVLVLGPSRAVGESRLVRISAEGEVRSVALPGVLSGAEDGHDSRPALAIDPATGRAFVVQAGGPVAEVELETLAVTSRPPVPGGRAPDSTRSAVRDALWLGGGRLAVTGYDDERPAGLTLVDTRDWTARRLDRHTTNAALAGGTLLAYSFVLSGRAPGGGVTGYSLAGERRFHRFGDTQLAGVQPLGRRALVAGPRAIAMLDARSGRVLRRYRRLLLTPILGDQAFSPTAAG
jgi:hypothetical protein